MAVYSETYMKRVGVSLYTLCGQNAALFNISGECEGYLAY